MTTYRPGYVPGKTKMSVYVDPDVHRALKVRAAETGESMGDIVERALRRELGMERLSLGRDEFAAAMGFADYEALMAASESVVQQGDVDWYVTRLPDGRWAAWDDSELSLDRVEFFDTREEALRHHEDAVHLTVETEYGSIVVVGGDVYYSDFDHKRFWKERSTSYTFRQDCYGEIIEAVADALHAEILDDHLTDYGMRALIRFPSGRKKWLWADHEGICWYDEDEFSDDADEEED